MRARATATTVVVVVLMVSALAGCPPETLERPPMSSLPATGAASPLGYEQWDISWGAVLFRVRDRESGVICIGAAAREGVTISCVPAQPLPAEAVPTYRDAASRSIPAGTRP